MTCFKRVAAATIVVGLSSGCGAAAPYAGNPAAPIEVEEVAFGHRYSQAQQELDRAHLFRVLQQGGAPVTEELRGRGAIAAMAVIFGGLGGGFIGWPLGGAAAGDADQPWFLAAIGAGTLSVILPIEARADARVHRAVLLHNAHHGEGSLSSVPSLRPLRSSWLARSVFSGGYTTVDETIPSAGSTGDLSLSGPSAGYDWSLGYFLAPGLALTANVLGMTQITKEVSSEVPTIHGSADVLLHYTAALANLNYYFLPDLGLYGFAGAGYGVEAAENESTLVQPDASGLALSGGVGWDFTIANSGALGVVVRGLYSPLKGEFSEQAGDGTPQRMSFVDRWTGLSIGLSLTYY